MAEGTEATVTPLERARFKDFDSAAAQETPVTFRVKGIEYVCPPDLDAVKVLMLIKEGAMSDPSKTVELLEAMVGADNLRRLGEDRVPLKTVMEITRWLAREYELFEEGGTPNPPKR